MPPTLPSPLEVLRKGLAKLKETTESRKNDILARLHKGNRVNPSEEAFVDDNANFTDEQLIIDSLDRASDYDKAVSQLTPNQKTVVDRLRELAGVMNPTNIKKRKRPDHKPSPKSLANKEKAAEEPVFTEKQNATLEQRIEVLDWHHKNGKSQKKTAEHFDKQWPNLKLKQPLVSKWLKDEAKWRARYEESQGFDHTAKRLRQTQHPEVTDMMDLWVEKAKADNLVLTGEVLRQKWKTFADIVGVPQDERLDLSDGWLTRFKQRHGLKELRRHGEAGSADPNDVEAERKRMRELIEMYATKYGYRVRDIFNMDETGLFYAMPPDRGLAEKKTAGVKGKKVRLTYALTMNADGSEKREAFIIGKAHKPRPFAKKTGEQLGFYYRNNAKAWMTAVLYQEWLRKWDQELRAQNRHILLLVDNFAGHIPPDNLTHIKCEPFRPNLTAHVQPADAGIIRCFKAHYRARFIERAIDRYDRGVTPGAIYDTNQLEGMRMAEQAWNEVTPETIRNCWRKTGILPSSLTGDAPLTGSTSSAEALVTQAELGVTAALDNLQITGALHASDRLDVEELVNRDDEKVQNDATDEEIYQAVMSARAAQDNADGDDDVDDDADFVPPPSRADALAAVDLLLRYTNAVDGPFARKVDTILSSFGRQTRTEAVKHMKDTHIYNYFTQKDA